MNKTRAYTILGLIEGAGREKVEEAYARRMKLYDSGDYADDKQYVRQKKAELKEAYEYIIGGCRDEMAERPKAKPDRVASFREKILGEEDREEYNDDDYSSYDYYDSDDDEERDVREDRREHSNRKKRKDDKERAEFKLAEFGSILKRTAKGGGSVTKKFKSSKSKFPVSFAYVIVFIVLVFSITSINTPDFFDFDEPSHVYLTEEETSLYESAGDCNTYLWSQDYEDVEVSNCKEESVKIQADKFAAKCGDFNDFKSLMSYLYDNYDDFYATEDDDFDEQLCSVLEFYDFDEFDSALGHFSPYNGEPIRNMLDYMKYINEYLERGELE